MLQQSRAELRSSVGVDDAEGTLALGAMQGKQLWSMLHIMLAAPRKHLLWGCLVAMALRPHDMAVPTVQAK